MDDQPKPSVRYESYLLRLRREERDGELVCQVMLQSVDSEEQRYFANLESMVAYLEEQAQGEQQGNRVRAPP
jgi:hypothetical protein